MAAQPSGQGLRLHHVQLSIPPGSEARCRQFYVHALGMTELEKPAALTARGGFWVRGDDLEIHLGVEPDFRPARKAHPGILVSDLELLAARLERHGVEVTWDRNLPGFRRFYASDSVGNRLEFLSANPPTSKPVG